MKFKLYADKAFEATDMDDAIAKLAKCFQGWKNNTNSSLDELRGVGVISIINLDLNKPKAKRRRS